MEPANGSRVAVTRRLTLVAIFVLAGVAGRTTAAAATARTANFIVHARTQAMADEIGRAAEHYRRELALEWTGEVMPRWSAPCPIHVKEGNIGAGGATSFKFDRGQVFGWKMNVQGTMERILDSVLPHEVSHTIFACYFARPLPRWADEGAATLVEHEAERRRQTRLLSQVIRTRRRIPLAELLGMTEYPRDMNDVLTLYAEGYSLADLLVQEQGKTVYLKFLGTAHREGWSQALQRHYGYSSIAALEDRWHGWVMAGSPRLENMAPDGALLAGGDAFDRAAVARGETPQLLADARTPLAGRARGQSPDHTLSNERTPTTSPAAASDQPSQDRTGLGTLALGEAVPIQTVNSDEQPFGHEFERSIPATPSLRGRASLASSQNAPSSTADAGRSPLREVTNPSLRGRSFEQSAPAQPPRRLPRDRVREPILRQAARSQ